jgi:hypothetical protein
MRFSKSPHRLALNRGNNNALRRYSQAPRSERTDVPGRFQAKTPDNGVQMPDVQDADER